MKTLGQQLGTLFSAPVKHPSDPFKHAKTRARQIAAACGVGIESVRGGGFNVWPPRSNSHPDSYEGDHYAADWKEVLVMVEAYSQIAAKQSTAPLSEVPRT